MGVKKILSLTAILAGVYFIGRGAAPDLGEVLDYVNANPQHQELVINKTMYSREKRKLDYSSETLGNFSRALLQEFSKEKYKQEQEPMKEYEMEKPKTSRNNFDELKRNVYELVMNNIFDKENE